MIELDSEIVILFKFGQGSLFNVSDEFTNQMRFQYVKTFEKFAVQVYYVLKCNTKEITYYTDNA